MSEREAINPDGTITLYDQRTDSYVTVPFDLVRKQLIYRSLPPEQTHLLHDWGLGDDGNRRYAVECLAKEVELPCLDTGVDSLVLMLREDWNEILYGVHLSGPGPWPVTERWDNQKQRCMFVVVDSGNTEGEQQ